MNVAVSLLTFILISSCNNKVKEEIKFNKETDTSESSKIKVLNFSTFHFGSTPGANKTEFDEEDEERGPIIISVMAGNKRFTDIQNSIPGITSKALAKELMDLEEHQLIKRTVIDDFPVKILNQPDIHVHTLIPIIDALKDWGLKHREKLFFGK